MFQPHDLVSDLLSQHPQVFPVFERHGMCDDCKASPPPVPISHFAEKHCNGEVDRFLHELEQAR